MNESESPPTSPLPAPRPTQNATEGDKPKRGIRFWLVFFSLFVSFFLVCLEATVVSTALPTIAKDLQITQFVWIGSTYALANAAILPLCGGLAQVFGRKPVILGSLALFIAGSAIGGAAAERGNTFLRPEFGMGGGGTLALCTIIVSDLVSLSERGAFNGILGLAWCFSGGIGPVVGGALAQQGQWRWIFYMNIAIAAFAFLMTLFTLRLPIPPGTMTEKLMKIDWGVRNAIIISSTAACSIGLTWGGIEFSWNSAHVLVPLILGVVGIAAFLLYEAKMTRFPLVPFHIVANRTSLSGFLQTFILSMPHLSLLYYLPVYYQACKDASPTASGVDLFGIAFSIAPITMLTGFSVNVFKRYRPQLWLGWAILVVASGLLNTITADSSRAKSIGFQIINGLGIGLLYMNLYFPILAPLPITSSAQALAFYNYVRALAQTWGVTIGSTVLQNQLKKRLPLGFSQLFPEGIEIAYAAIPQIQGLPQPLKDQVRVAFAQSLSKLWELHIGLAGLGLLASLLMRGLPLHTQLDKKWEMGNNDPGSQFANNKNF
ncbi:major facilitator superfamily domain-containing protein [Mycena olivaceomarginata]|nr:major facilitator superfamily domain-containing protein [Mycena olivaceomarginata]